jgi:ubiquinone/menaquinone biosynthesis C-methylase UbiE
VNSDRGFNRNSSIEINPVTKEHYTWFDRWVAGMRYRAAEKYITPDSRVCDVGCGVDALFLKKLVPLTRCRVGLDYQEITEKVPGTEFFKVDVTGAFPLRDAAFDHVTLLAVIEHLTDPSLVFKETYRVLAPGGSLIVTWPHAWVDQILIVLWKIGLVSPTTEFHKHQPRKPAAYCVRLLRDLGFVEIRHSTFEFGLNNLLVAVKPL